MPLLASPTNAQEAVSRAPAVKVMTRNLYLGTDIMRPIVAVQGLPVDNDPVHQAALLDALAHATDTARDIVDATNFRVRGRLLAKEIATRKPDLVGLQEVALWRHGPFEIGNVGVPNATTVDYDFLKILQRKLRAQGMHYRAVSVNWLSDVEAPAYEGSLGVQPPTIQNARDVRLTMRDVILKRVGSPVKVLSHHERKYKNGLKVSIAGKDMNFTRGYQWVNAERNGRRFRFINTHLEAFSSDMAFKQVREMLNGPGRYKGNTIIVCDCNSDPLNGTVKSAPPVGDKLPHWAPYWLVTGRHGFSDTWLQWRQAQYGWTSGLSETVNDPDASGFDHRIDMVFARRGDGGRLKVVRGKVVGNTVASKDPATGLWPSDHAGVVMTLRVPR
jgi:endonuclease/exonuclease/phosphatase family metal-dependent hydrolase